MQLNITGHHVDLTDSLRNYVNEKFERIERHFDKVTNTHVILTIENTKDHKAEATIHVAGLDIYADNVENDMYVAIDGLIDKLDRQVKKHKEKITNHKHTKPVIATEE